ncbi:MAG: nuclear transport factor 2 family protein [Dehalococcoidia bacterium]
MSDLYSDLRQLVERYADAVCQRDADLWGSTWAPDGVWDLGRGKAEGRENIVAFWKQAMANYPQAIQIIHGGNVLEETATTARARWYLSEYLFVADGSRRLGIGVYHDDYVKLDGKWHFKLRKYGLLYSGTPDLAGDPLGFPFQNA